MNKLLFITILLTSFVFVSCDRSLEEENEMDKTFPKVKNLSEYKNTIFLLTLEKTFDTKENGIYAVSLLMAWDEIRNEISKPIKEFSSSELELMNNSEGYKNVLSKSEYSSSIEVEDLTIRAKAYFKKSLPFVIPLQKDDKPIQFLDDKVVSFGFYGYNEVARILYYHDDNDFAIRLIPKDNEHEIILIKSHFDNSINLKDEVHRLSDYMSEFKGNRNDNNHWKYYLNDEDQISIPLIEFNIETNYSEIEGSTFSAGKQNFFVDMVYQRTAFVLNEKGAEVESEAEIAVEAVAEEELPKPKRMFFDKPYLILLKRKDCKYPYFAMFVANSELMKKE